MEEKKESSTDSPPRQDNYALSAPAVPSTYIKPQGRKAHDADVKFEEYHYYAQTTREEEKSIETPKTNWGQLLFKKKEQHVGAIEGDHPVAPDAKFRNRADRLEITDEEWRNASRAFRSAGWGACKYLLVPPSCGVSKFGLLWWLAAVAN